MQEEFDMMRDNVEKHGKSLRGWKVYTAWGDVPYTSGWFLDDPVGRRVSARTSSRSATSTGSPRSSPCTRGSHSRDSTSAVRRLATSDPLRRKHPEVKFIIYHSGYDGERQHPYAGDDKVNSADRGVDTFVKSLRENGVDATSHIPPGLRTATRRTSMQRPGSVWRSVMRNTRDASHYLGKMIKYVGPVTHLLGNGQPVVRIAAVRDRCLPFVRVLAEGEGALQPALRDGRRRWDPRANCPDGRNYAPPIRTSRTGRPTAGPIPSVRSATGSSVATPPSSTRSTPTPRSTRSGATTCRRCATRDTSKATERPCVRRSPRTPFTASGRRGRPARAVVEAVVAMRMRTIVAPSRSLLATALCAVSGAAGRQARERPTSRLTRRVLVAGTSSITSSRMQEGGEIAVVRTFPGIPPVVGCAPEPSARVGDAPGRAPRQGAGSEGIGNLRWQPRSVLWATVGARDCEGRLVGGQEVPRAPRRVRRRSPQALRRPEGRHDHDRVRAPDRRRLPAGRKPVPSTFTSVKVDEVRGGERSRLASWRSFSACVASLIPGRSAQARAKRRLRRPNHPGGDWPSYGHDLSNTRSQPPRRRSILRTLQLSSRSGSSIPSHTEGRA